MKRDTPANFTRNGADKRSRRVITRRDWSCVKVDELSPKCTKARRKKKKNDQRFAKTDDDSSETSKDANMTKKSLTGADIAAALSKNAKGGMKSTSTKKGASTSTQSVSSKPKNGNGKLTSGRKSPNGLSASSNNSPRANKINRTSVFRSIAKKTPQKITSENISHVTSTTSSTKIRVRTVNRTSQSVTTSKSGARDKTTHPPKRIIMTATPKEAISVNASPDDSGIFDGESKDQSSSIEDKDEIAKKKVDHKNVTSTTKTTTKRQIIVDSSDDDFQYETINEELDDKDKDSSNNESKTHTSEENPIPKDTSLTAMKVSNSSPLPPPPRLLLKNTIQTRDSTTNSKNSPDTESKKKTNEESSKTQDASSIVRIVSNVRCNSPTLPSPPKLPSKKGTQSNASRTHSQKMMDAVVIDSSSEDEIKDSSDHDDSTSTISCQACQCVLRSSTASILYGIHAHPLLSICVCAPCAIRANDVESELSSEEASRCSLCAREEELTLFLCDLCPRGFCEVCLTSVCGEDKVKKLKTCDDKWGCLSCAPPGGLKVQQKKCSRLSEQEKEMWETRSVEQLLEELERLEDAIVEAEEMLEDEALEKKRCELNEELKEEEQLDAEMEVYVRLWEDHHTRLVEALPPVQEALEAKDVPLLSFYNHRNEGAEKPKDDEEWKRKADQEMDDRDKQAGFSRGAFRGASGYSHSHSEIYNLDPEDISSDVFQVEEINTTEGAFEQMSAVASAPPSSTRGEWGSTELKKTSDPSLIQKQFKKALLYDDFELSTHHSIDPEKLTVMTEEDDIVSDRKELDKGSVNWSEVKLCKARKKRRVKLHVEKEKMEKMKGADTADRVARLKGLDRPRRRIIPMPAAPSPPPPPPTWFDKPWQDGSTTLHASPKVTIVEPLAKVLKPHQIEGIKFMWGNVVISFCDLRANEKKARGCILAHNMGLGKSLQVIALLHSLLNHPVLTRNRPVEEEINGKYRNQKRRMHDPDGRYNKRLVFNALLCVPVNTLANWENEFKRWITKDISSIPMHNVHGLHQSKREAVVESWYYGGGVLLTSFEIFRSLSKLESINSILLKPDIIVIDEAHQALGSSNSGIFKALSSVTASRKIALTGTPLQNNLREYYHMANWARPFILGSEFQFEREYETPIMNGMASDSTNYSVRVQIAKSKQLHEILSPYMQRRDNTVLKEDLPFMQQSVIYVRQSKIQTKLFREFANYKKKKVGMSFLECYNKLRIALNHPSCLTLGSGRTSPTPKLGDENVEQPWWKEFSEKNPSMSSWINGGKIVLLLEILAHADSVGDKVVVFTQCLKTLDFIEQVLQTPSWEKNVPSLKSYSKSTFGPYRKNAEYLRIDGGTSASERGELITSFNEECINNSKVFLLSTRAGGVGINLTAANRVVIFDTHWNPARDLQALYRCYRYGQTKPVFAYRLLTEGTMEEKIYSRQVNKTGLAARVIDQRHPERVFSTDELNDLMSNDTWVQCDKCEKWRMLPPEADADVENLPEKWFCHMNTFDRDRSRCEAQEEDQKWYLEYFRTRHEKKRLSLGSDRGFNTPNRKKQRDEAVDNVDDVEDDSKIAFTERDVVLQRLLQIPISATRARKLNSPTKTSNKKMIKNSSSCWISKYHFHDSLLEDSDPLTSQITPEQVKKKSKTPEKRKTPKKKDKTPENKKSKTSPSAIEISSKNSTPESKAIETSKTQRTYPPPPNLPKPSPRRSIDSKGVHELTMSTLQRSREIIREKQRLKNGAVSHRKVARRSPDKAGQKSRKREQEEEEASAFQPKPERKIPRKKRRGFLRRNMDNVDTEVIDISSDDE